jgi:hypothetical protein
MTQYFPCGNEYRPGYKPIPFPKKKPPGGGGDLIGIVEPRIPPIITPPYTPIDPFPTDPGPGSPGLPSIPNPGNAYYFRYRCLEAPVYCPDNRTIRTYNKTCDPIRLTDFPPSLAIRQAYPHDTIQKCQAVCGPSSPSSCPPTVIRGPTTGQDDENPEYELWKCEETPVYCPDSQTIQFTRRNCVSIIVRNFPPPPIVIFQQYRFRTLDQCLNSSCVTDTNYRICPPITGQIYITEPPRRGGDNTFEDIGISFPDRLVTGVVDPINIDTGTNSSKIVDIIDLPDSGGGESSFQNGSRIGSNIPSGLVYDPVRNIFNYSVNNGFTDNRKHLNVFGVRIAREIDYMLKNYDSSNPWKERFVFPLTYEKIKTSLNSELRNNLENILDVDGRKVNPDLFLYGILNHLLNNTIDELDTTYFNRLSNATASRTQLSLQNSNLRGNIPAILNFVKSRMVSADPKRYEGISKAEVARMRFLLTDLNAKVKATTIAEEELTVPLEDPGLPFTVSGEVLDHIPLGDGDGYYLYLETSAGSVTSIPLETSLSASYYLPLQDRKIALSLLNEASELSFTVSSSFINSELSSGYQEVYTVQPQYFKLDLTSIKNNLKPGKFINQVEANYIKLTDLDEITQHSKNYGAKATKLNVPYDDPFYQYADREGVLSLAMNEITYQETDINETPNRGFIILRSLPDVIILFPAKTTEENPFNATSKITYVTNSHVVRNFKATTNIGLTSDSTINRNSLPYKYTYDYLGTFKFGIEGIVETENLIYVYEPSSFPVSYEVSGRSGIGHAVYNILENTIKQKYTYTYLTWWDLFRRMKLKDLLNFYRSAPNFLLQEMQSGWGDYVFKHVLYRGSNYRLTNLTEVDPNIDDPIILSETFDRSTQNY